MKIAEKNGFIGGKTESLKAMLFAMIMISAAFVGIIGNVGAVDTYEPDNTPAQATPIPTDGTIQSHDFDPPGDEDWVMFSIIPGTIYTIETLDLGPPCNTYIYLYESDGVTLIAEDDNSGLDLASRIVWNSTGYTAGNYYVRVIEIGGNAGPGYSYNIRVFEGVYAEFLPPHSDYGLDTGIDGLFDYLIVEVMVNVGMAGDYRIYGDLYDSSWDWIEGVNNYTYLQVGIQTVELRFEGWKIYNNGDNGSYNIDLWLRDASWELLDSDTHVTNFYWYDEFQIPPAVFEPPHSDYGLDTGIDGLFNYLIVEVVVNVGVAGNYRIYSDLFDSSWNWIWDAYNYTYLNLGIQTVELRFEGWKIYNNGDNGSYYVNLELRDASRNWLDSDTHITNFYWYDEFQPPPAIFYPPHSDYGLDTDGDPYYNYLVVEVMVNVTVAGDYRIYGDLYNSTGYWIEGVNNYTYLNPGIQAVELRFEGWRIYSNGDNGAYNVNLRLRDASGNWLDSDSHVTNFYLYDEYQPPPAFFAPPHSDHGLDTDGDPYYNYLVVEVMVNVGMAGDYRIYGDLFDSSWDWIEGVNNYTYLNVGIQTVQLRFEGWKIYNEGDNGTYNVDLRLRDSSENWLDSDAYVTNFYWYDEFQLPPACFEPPHSDYGLDTDGDPYYNYLIVEVMVNVSKAGDYRVYGDLFDSSWDWIENYYNYTFLTAGIQTVELRFKGWKIYYEGDNGTYNVDLQIRDSSWNWLDSDTHVTNFYTYDQFDRVPAEFFPPHSDYGLDTDGDPYYNYLVVNVIINVSEARDYEIRGRLYDGSWDWIEDYYNYTFLAVGIQTVELRFEGWRIYNNGDDCSYNINLELCDDSGVLLDWETYITGFYTYDEFQPPPAFFYIPHSDYGLDTDGDPYYNYLIVEVMVNVSKAGEYRIYGDLYDSTKYWIEGVNNYTFLPVGIQTVELRFDGQEIYKNGDNGSYYVELQLYDSSWNWLDSDTHITNFYTYDQFQPPPASLTGNFNDYGLDTDGDTFFNHLVIEAEVEVKVAGDYYVEIDLHDFPTMDHITQNTSVLTFLPVGTNLVSVYLEGLDIRLSGYDGPYMLDDVWLYDDGWNLLDYLGDPYTTAAYNCTDFQPLPAEFFPPHSDYGLDTDGDPYYNYLDVEVMVNVSAAGNYNIYGSLYDSSWDWIDNVNNYTYLNPGIQTVELRFEGLDIFRHGVDGPYNVNLELYDESWNFLDSDTHITNFYIYDQFQPPPAFFEPPHSDYGLDTDGDPYYNYLVVEVVVNVSAAGNYHMYGYLYDSSWNWIDDDYNYTFLNAGIQVVELRFEGLDIFGNGMDGPYNVNLDLYNESWVWCDSDTHITAAYLRTEFEWYARFEPPHSDFGLDTDGDSSFNYLVVNVMVNVTTAGDYLIIGDLWDQSNSVLITSASNFKALNTGPQMVQLYFAGGVINEHSIDGPYLIELELYNDVNNLYDRGNYLTSTYLYTQFQPLPPAIIPPWLDDFEFGSLGGSLGVNWTASDTNRAGVGFHTSTSGNYSMYTRWGTVTVTSYFVDMSGLIGAEVLCWIRRGGSFSEDPDANEDLVLEYKNDLGNWIELETFTGAGTPGEIFIRNYTLPADALHSTFQLRFHQTGGNGIDCDYWHIDDVYIRPLDNLAPQITNVRINGELSIVVPAGTIVTLTATIDDSATGNSKIGGANYTLGPENWPGINMTSSDGLFDEPTEDVTISIATGGWSEGSHYLYVYGWDIVPNNNTFSTAYATIIIDSILPANITDLDVVSTECNSATLTWTAPGDDDMSGTASQYDIRYSTLGPIITDTDFDNAMEVAGEPMPQPANSPETFIVTGLNANTKYWFAIKTADEVPNWSGISNSPNGTTIADNIAPQISNVRVNGVTSMVVSAGTIVTLTATISDSVTGNSDIGGANFTMWPENWPSAKDMGPSDGMFNEPTEDVNISVATGGWSEGSHYLYVYGWDQIPNYNTISTAYATIIVDSTPPTSSVDAISPFWQIISPLTVTATASDSLSDVVSVTLWYRYSVDNSIWGSWTSFGTDTSSPWSWAFNFPDGDGYYEFYSIAVDAAGHTEVTPGIRDALCAYDTELPTSTVDTISPYWWTPSPLPIAATANDAGSGLASVELYYRYSTDNSSWGQWVSFGVLTQTPWEWSFNFPDGDGCYEFYTKATDEAANEEGGLGVEAICGYDVTPPTANAGADQVVLQSSLVTFDCSGSSDNILLVNRTWTFEDGVIRTLYGVNPTYTFNTPGNYLVTLNVTDAAGNWDIDTMWVNVSEVANTGSISGVVRDEDGDPIEGATITVVGTPYKATTNATGHYTISNVPAGTYNVTITKSGYETETITDVSVSAGQDSQIEVFAMKRSPEKEVMNYWWILLVVVIIVVIILVLLLAKGRKKGPEKVPERFEDYGSLEPESPPTPPEPTDLEEPYQPISPEPEHIPPPEQTPPPPPPL